MNKKPSGTQAASTLLFRIFASHAAMMSLAFSLHAGAQQLQEINQPTTTAFASANPPRLPVDPTPDSLIDAPSAIFSRTAATGDAATPEAAAAGVVRPPPAKLTREEKN